MYSDDCRIKKDAQLDSFPTIDADTIPTIYGPGAARMRFRCPTCGRFVRAPWNRKRSESEQLLMPVHGPVAQVS